MNYGDEVAAGKLQYTGCIQLTNSHERGRLYNDLLLRIIFISCRNILMHIFYIHFFKDNRGYLTCNENIEQKGAATTKLSFSKPEKAFMEYPETVY